MGDPVYLIRRSGRGLDLGAERCILQVVAIKLSGVLRLQGKDGRCSSEHRTNLAPCRLPDLDLTVDPSLARPAQSTACELCQEEDPIGAKIILCSMCSAGWHWACLRRQALVVSASPPPEDRVWYCPYCIQLRVPIVPVDSEGVEVKVTSKNSMDVSLAILLPAIRERPKCAVPQDLRNVSQRSLVSTDSVRTLLTTAFEARWSYDHAERLSQVLNASPRCTVLQSPQVVDRAACDSLHGAFDWSQLRGVWDPWGGSQVVSAMLLSLEKPLLLTQFGQGNGFLHALASPVEPRDLERVLAMAGSSVDAIVSAPAIGLIDLAIAAAVQLGLVMTCWLVPCHYVTAAPPPRADFLQRMAEEGRLLLLANAATHCCHQTSWVVLFRSETDKERIVPRHVRRMSKSWEMGQVVPVGT